MEKKRTLILDSKRVFYKMFNKKLNSDDFSQNVFLWNENVNKDYNTVVLVIYNHLELLDFLQTYTRGTNVLICVFNKELFSSLISLQEISQFVFLNASKIKSEILTDLRKYFNPESHLKKNHSNSFSSDLLHVNNHFNETLKSFIVKAVA